ncbi:MAG: alpha/beta hydrolase [Chloroflexi bacterium]|nr:alpha/beta hydrolase [Chloroflexota bacterium]
MIQYRSYGTSGQFVVVLHGGPGAPGNMAPVAGALSDRFRVLEPWQRGSGGEPLTVARHVADLHELIEARCGEAPPALVGHSWGAMLALAYAAAHLSHVAALALIGCGTFDPMARARMTAILDERMDDAVRRQLELSQEQYPDPDERLRFRARLTLKLSSYDLISTDLGDEPPDARSNRESWDDMVRLQEVGIYPAAFAAIGAPVIMLHGAVDPHPGGMIRQGLQSYLPQLEYREWERCGHYPWLERAVRDEFYSVLRQWLTRQFALGTPPASAG